MTITLHIDRIVLDGVPLQARDVSGLRDALQAELADRIVAMSRTAWHGSVKASVTEVVTLSAACDPATVASVIGRSVERGLQR